MKGSRICYAKLSYKKIRALWNNSNYFLRANLHNSIQLSDPTNYSILYHRATLDLFSLLLLLPSLSVAVRAAYYEQTLQASSSSSIWLLRPEMPLTSSFFSFSLSLFLFFFWESSSELQKRQPATLRLWWQQQHFSDYCHREDGINCSINSSRGIWELCCLTIQHSYIQPFPHSLCRVLDLLHLE